MAQALGLNFVVAEKSGKTAQTGIWIPSATSLANAQYAAQAFALLMETILEGAITGANLVIPVSLAGIGLARSAPSDGSSLSEGVMFGFRTGSGYKTSFRVPTVKETIFNPDRTVDTNDAAVAALITAMVDGISIVPVGGSGAVAPVNISDESITGLRLAREAYKRTNR